MKKPSYLKSGLHTTLLNSLCKLWPEAKYFLVIGCLILIGCEFSQPLLYPGQRLSWVHEQRDNSLCQPGNYLMIGEVIKMNRKTDLPDNLYIQFSSYFLNQERGSNAENNSI